MKCLFIFFRISICGWALVENAFNPNTQNAENDRALWGQSHPSVQSEFQNSQNCVERTCLKQNKIKQKQTLKPNKTKQNIHLCKADTFLQKCL